MSNDRRTDVIIDGVVLDPDTATWLALAVEEYNAANPSDGTTVQAMISAMIRDVAIDSMIVEDEARAEALVANHGWHRYH